LVSLAIAHFKKQTCHADTDIAMQHSPRVLSPEATPLQRMSFLQLSFSNWSHFCVKTVFSVSYYLVFQCMH